MEATVRTICPSCGHVELSVVDVELEITVGRDKGRYRFECPTCGGMHQHVAPGRVVDALIAAGVSYEIVTEMGPITEQEVSDFASALDGDDWSGQVDSID